MTDAEIYEAAADLLEKPGAWTQGEEARDARGRLVSPTSSAATCWCALGALYRFGMPDHDEAYRPLRQATGCRWIAVWNDGHTRTQAEVVSALRKAAELARAGQ